LPLFLLKDGQPQGLSLPRQLMIINSTLIYCLIPELKRATQGHRITDVLVSSDYKELLFRLRGKHEEITLFFSTHPVDCRIEIWGKMETDQHTQTYQKSKLFDFAVGGHIQDVEQLDFDRVIRLSCEKKSQWGEGEKFDLIFELTGRNSNVILTKNEMVIDCLRRIDITQNRFRQISPGQKYVQPPPPKKKNPFTIDKDEFIHLSKTPQPVFDWLAGHFIGIDRLLAQSIAFDSGFDLNKKISQQEEDEMEQLWGAFRHTFEKLSHPQATYLIINNPDGKPEAISCVELPFIPEDRKLHFPDLNSAIKSFFSVKLGTEKTHKELHKLSSLVNRALAKLNEREKKIESDLENAARSEEYRRYGDLLMMNKENIPKGQASAELKDMFDSRHPTVQIPLDSKLNAIANAQLYFKKYRKAKDALSIIKKRKEETKRLIDLLEEIYGRLSGQIDLTDLEEQKQTLIRLGLLRPVRSPAKEKRKKEFSPRRFSTKTGWEIFVGKNDQENDYLTFKFARPDDLWFHAQNVPGSHVVLRKKDKKSEPSFSEIKETAQVAAYYSKSRKEKKVSVAYTPAKHVRKPKKGKPGLALVTREKSIMVEPKLPADKL
jgi:predicted ribosome quality control (RQC) complex YloA/Tae2 family protein